MCTSRRSRQFVLLALAILPAFALALPLSTPVSAHASGGPKISPALLAQMTSNPLQRLPLILEMSPPSAPFSRGAEAAAPAGRA